MYRIQKWIHWKLQHFSVHNFIRWNGSNTDEHIRIRMVEIAALLEKFLSKIFKSSYLELWETAHVRASSSWRKDYLWFLFIDVEIFMNRMNNVRKKIWKNDSIHARIASTETYIWFLVPTIYTLILLLFIYLLSLRHLLEIFFSKSSWAGARVCS